MIVNRDSWHYKVWAWSHSWAWSTSTVPYETNLCSYIRRLMFVVPFQAFMIGVISCLYAVFALFPIAILRWFFGYKTTSLDVQMEPEEYSGLQVGTKEIFPWHVALPAIIIGTEVYAFTHAPALAIGIVNAAIFGLIGIVVGVFFLCNSERTSIFRDWFWAKKSKICPRVTFGDHYESPNQDDELDVDEEL